jgi:DNA-binding NarL/FixJ family response regulator
MSLWQQFQRWWKGRKLNTTRTYSLDETLDDTVLNLAVQVNRSVNEVKSDVLIFGLDLYQKNVATRRLWDSLAPREQDVSAFTCLGYSNRQIAYKMGIAESTVKSYLQSVLQKLGIRSKSELRLIFAHFNFEAWGPPVSG